MPGTRSLAVRQPLAAVTNDQFTSWSTTTPNYYPDINSAFETPILRSLLSSQLSWQDSPVRRDWESLEKGGSGGPICVPKPLKGSLGVPSHLILCVVCFQCRTPVHTQKLPVPTHSWSVTLQQNLTQLNSGWSQSTCFRNFTALETFVWQFGHRSFNLR